MERDSRSMVRAKARVSAAGLTNVSFMESDVPRYGPPNLLTPLWVVSYCSLFLIPLPFCAVWVG